MQARQYQAHVEPLWVGPRPDWFPVYPDFAPGRTLPVATMPTFEFVFSLNHWLPPGLGWLPSYPDFARRAPMPVMPDAEAWASFPFPHPNAFTFAAPTRTKVFAAPERHE